ncbi:methionyl-tRNA formyltransferase [Geosporobacter subterraneus DSM 17957]|uniref:Methionyl-tRNA formyltransferase n=1 Tax=Geosporobacter subterraneus DSM 17957 TaxID=1121919 RepID=A0A1M6GRV0_9FIRM|nr:methionyl-tRNA formyltransferase [Geosporobacter subterraneus]SHJ12657.1 methionyl-tRNA formyltransferase [Geosporobacter subterraneus DSM 17957]
MKIVFMGTPDFAVPCLAEIIQRGYQVLMVVTQPDRPKGRGKKLTAPPVKELALRHNLPVIQPEKVRDPEIVEQLRALKPDCIVVVAFGQILPKSILEIPPLGCINVHASLLPQYRGAAPINWAIINGEKISGVTTMYMDQGLDTGDMILKKQLMIGEMTAGELYDQMAVLGADLLGETLSLIEKGIAHRIPQIDSESSYAPIMDKNLGKIDWNKSAMDIYNLIRGVNPWPTAYTTYKGENFKIWESRIVDQDCHGKPGQIIKANKDGLLVCTGDKLLNIQVVQFQNSKRMTVDEYLRGHAIEENNILGE